MDKRFFNVILVFLTSLGISLSLGAQISADPSNPTSIGFSSKNKKKKSDWTFAGSASTVRGLDYYAKVYLSYSVSAIYKFKHQQSASTSLSYSVPVDGEVMFTEDWGLKDLSFSYNKGNILKLSKKTKTSLRLGLVLPTSEVSQRTTLKIGTSASLPTSLRWVGNTFVVSPGLGASMHKYETADKAGTQENSPFYMSLSLVASRTLYKKLSGSLSAGFVNLANYDFSFKQIQFLGASMTLPLYGKTSLTGGYSWRDRRISHNAVFDDDRAKYFLSLSVVL